MKNSRLSAVRLIGERVSFWRVVSALCLTSALPLFGFAQSTEDGNSGNQLRRQSGDNQQKPYYPPKTPSSNAPKYDVGRAILGEIGKSIQRDEQYRQNERNNQQYPQRDRMNGEQNPRRFPTYNIAPGNSVPNYSDPSDDDSYFTPTIQTPFRNKVPNAATVQTPLRNALPTEPTAQTPLPRNTLPIETTAPAPLKNNVPISVVKNTLSESTDASDETLVPFKCPFTGCTKMIPKSQLPAASP